VATSAHLNKPTGVTLDIFGNLFIADTGNNVVREVPVDNIGTMVAGNIYTVAGDNVGHAAGYTGEGGTAVGAQMNAPQAWWWITPTTFSSPTPITTSSAK